MRVIALSLLASLAFADTHADVVDLFAGMASALSVDNPAGFMQGVDRKTPDYEGLQARIAALVQTSEIANSIELLKDEGTETRREVDLDWYLELRSRSPGGPLVHKREVIHCSVEKQGRHWRITSLQPAAFFDTPK